MALQLGLGSRPGRHCWCAASAGSAGSGGNASRRRSQRLRQPRDNSRKGDLQSQLREKESRLAEQQLLLQQQEQKAQQDRWGPEEARWQAGGDLEAQRLQEQATRGILADLEPEDEPADDPRQAVEAVGDSQPPGRGSRNAATAAAAAANAAWGEADSKTAAGMGAPDGPAREAVEPDFILEQQGAQALGQQRMQAIESEISRQSEALIAIIQAGEQVEEVIAQHRAEIDATMLKLLERRIQAVQQLEKRPDVIEGLQLLYRRLKAEVDRQRASPALRLLDELMGILDPGEVDTLVQTSTQEERRRAAAAHVRAAFSGGLSSAGGADVLSLAAQLSEGGGQQLADQLVADPVDPMMFMAESTELLRRVQEQLRQLEAVLEQRQQELQRVQKQEGQGRRREGGDGGELAAGEDKVEAAEAEDTPPSEQARDAAAAVLKVEGSLEQRQAAATLVQDSLEIAQAVMQQLQLGM